MASDKEFWEAYRHPLWQQKRLEVMQAAEFACQSCGTNEITLNVHHKFYRKGAKPWEYENSELMCLCKPCHEKTHDVLAQLKAALNQLDRLDLTQCLGYVRYLLLRSPLSPNLCVPMGEDNEFMGLAHAAEITGRGCFPMLFDSSFEVEGEEGRFIDYKTLKQVRDALRAQNESTN